MLRVNTDKDWEKFGTADPYYGVFSADRFRSANVTEETKTEFFASGEAHIARCLAVAQKSFGFQPGGTALDYGCGTGRLTNALASTFENVVGVDISQGMLDEASRETRKRKHANIRYVLGTDMAWASTSYDFIHSFIVFQHIPVARGEAILRAMIAALNEGGVGAVHLTYAETEAPVRALVRRTAKEFLPLRVFANVVQGRSWNEPSMQMNRYDLGRLYQILADAGIETFFTHRVDDFGNLGVFLFFQKRGGGAAASPWSTPRPA